MFEEKLIQSLIERGYFHTEDFLSPELCKDLIKDLKSLPLRAAKIGTGSSEKKVPAIRNDSLFWLSENSESIPQLEYLKKISPLMNYINEHLYLGLKQFEGHYAKYDAGGFYKKHIDQFKGNNERLISIVSYLNTPNSGGELRIYSKNNIDQIEVEIAPKAGGMVCFLSDQIYHEVLPTLEERLSIAGWLRTTIL